MSCAKTLGARARARQGGFAYIAAVVLLVVVAGLVAALLRLTTAQQATANDALSIARAGMAARGGVEWMVYQVSRNNACPNPQPGVLADFRAASGFVVRVTCSMTAYNEGQDPATATSDPAVKHIYRIVSVACNGTSGDCPDNGAAGAPDYVERRRVATICIGRNGDPCY